MSHLVSLLLLFHYVVLIYVCFSHLFLDAVRKS